MQLSYSNNIFCEIAGKIHLLLTPRKTDGRVHGQQGTPATCNLQPDLLGSFPADVRPDITGQFWSGHKANIQVLGVGGSFLTGLSVLK